MLVLASILIEKKINSYKYSVFLSFNAYIEFLEDFYVFLINKDIVIHENNGKDEKKKPYVDLHVHSTCSDGSVQVRQIIEYASLRKLSFISLTDHDCTEGVSEAIQLGSMVGIEVIPGVEMSTVLDGSDIHVLGYFFDHNFPPLLERLVEQRKLRYERAGRMVERLNKGGLNLSLEKVEEFVTGLTIGRPQIAQALIAEEFVDSISQAFEKYIGNHTEYYIPVDKSHPTDAIKLIHEAGGIAIMAHPVSTNRKDLTEEIIAAGIDGFEVYCPRQSYGSFKEYRQLCRKYGLIYGGGSDFHGPRFDQISLGSANVPFSVLENMQRYINKKRAQGLIGPGYSLP